MRANSKKLIAKIGLLALIAASFSIVSVAPAFAAAGSVTNGLCTSTVGETTTVEVFQVGNDCVVRFTSGSNSWTPPTDVREIDLLVVAGGGAGGRRSGGGGGAGGLVYLTNINVTPGTAVSLAVGAGGASANSTYAQGANGSDSTFSLTSVVTAKGGGGGGSGGGVTYAGLAGGSSGGSLGATLSSNAPGAATQPAQNYGYGNTGALGSGYSGAPNYEWTGGGGGGAGGGGTAGNTNGTAGSGGAGRIISITGADVCYAAGGGGGKEYSTATPVGAGGNCGGSAIGGAGSKGNTAATAGSANTGSGGGGSGFQDGSGDGTSGAGGSGIVIVRWTIPGNAGAFPNISGISARFNASNFNTTLNSNLGTWADTSGTGKHITGSNITGTAITMGTSGSAANGATKSFNVVNGTEASNIQMLSAAHLTGKYTLFSVARYSGANKNRIFQATGENASNYLSGFYNGLSGVHFKSGWYTLEAQASDITASNWLVSSECSYDPSVNTTINSCSATYSANGRQRSYIYNTITSATYGIGINGKGYYSGQSSNFQIADFIVFDRVLTITEVNQVETYISQKYGLPIYSDLIANYDPGDASTTNLYLKNLGKGDGSITESLDMTLYRNTLASPENSGTLKFSLSNGSYGQTTNGMRPMSRFSASTWLKSTGTQSSDWNSVLTTVHGGSGAIAPVIATFGRNVNAGFYNGSSWHTGYANMTSSAYAITDEVWYHVYTTFDGVNVRIYVNGILQSTTASNADSQRWAGLLRLGSRWDGNQWQYGFNGSVGKTRIYDHARTDAQVLAEFNDDKSRYICNPTYNTSGGNMIVTFTNPGTCSWTAPAGVTSVRTLLTGGGGGGGSWVGSGGGGGGVIDQSNVLVTPGTSYPIIIAGGGKGALTTSANAIYYAAVGGNTSALGYTAYGGGYGGTWNHIGIAGATGGGGSYNNTISSLYPTQGFAGGADAYNGDYGLPTGGGGGAGAVGGAATVTVGVSGRSGNGGAGKESAISGSIAYYGGGGGGGCHGRSTYICYVGNGGIGGGGIGGGNGAVASSWTSLNTVLLGGVGTANTGGGGGGSGMPNTNSSNVDSLGGAGGSGIVVISYAIFTLQPANDTTTAGLVDSFTIRTSAAPVDMTRAIKWQVATDTVTAAATVAWTDLTSGSGSTNGTGFTTDTFTTATLTTAMNKFRYRVIITFSGSNGTLTETSTVATLTVNPAITITSSTLTITKKYGVGEIRTVAFTGGTDTRTVSASSLSLAGGKITFDTATARFTIDSRTAVGTYLDTITITDAKGATASYVQTITFTVADTLTVTSDTPTALTYTGSPANFNPTVSAVSGLVTGDVISGATYNFSATAASCAAGGLCSIGQTGPGGGLVFITPSTSGNTTGRYFEAAPSGWNGTAADPVGKFCTNAVLIAGASGTEIGAGETNTNLIANNATCGASAADTATALVLGGKDDWFLPSFDELKEMYSKLHKAVGGALGGFNTGLNTDYLSSSDHPTLNGYAMYGWFGSSDGVAGWGSTSKTQPWAYRPVRSFVATSTSTINYGPTTTKPVNAATYTITPSSLTFSDGAASNYVNITYQTSTLTINKATQAALVVTPLYNAFNGNPTSATLLTSGGSDTGTVTYAYVASGSTANGCTLSGSDSSTVTVTSAGTCRIVATKAATNNFLIAISETATVTFYLYVTNIPGPRAAAYSAEIVLSGSTAMTSNGLAPTITFTGTDISAQSPGGTFTISGSGFIGTRLVRVAGTNASFTVLSDTSLRITMPSGLVGISGPIYVEKAEGSRGSEDWVIGTA